MKNNYEEKDVYSCIDFFTSNLQEYLSYVIHACSISIVLRLWFLCYLQTKVQLGENY